MFKLRAPLLLLAVPLGLSACGLLLEIPDDPESNPPVENHGGEKPDDESSGGHGNVAHEPSPTGGVQAQGGEAASGGDANTGGEMNVPFCVENCDCKQECDCDDDGALAQSCDGLDCDDEDPRVFPGQTKFFASRSTNPSVGFDFNCSGQLESPAENVAVTCEGLTLGVCTSAQGFLDGIPACGDSGKWGVCRVVTLACTDSVVDPEKAVLCH